MKFIFDIITRLSLRFRYLTIAMVVLLMVLGVISWTRLNQELLPPIELPQTIILAQTSGLSSDQVLNIVTSRLEDEIIQIDEIINLESQTTGTFGALITAYNDFGLDQQALQADIQAAVDRVWLPLRRIETDTPSTLLADLTPDVIVYLASQDSNFLFQLSPDVWASLNDETVEQALAFLANQTDAQSTTTNALQRLVEKEVVPQLDTIPEVARIEVSGGETLPDQEDDERTEAPRVTSTDSLLLRLSPDVWSVVAPRINGLSELNQEAVDQLAAIRVDVPTVPPTLPESWVQDADGNMTHFNTADDLLEIQTLTTSAGGVLNEFYETGRIIGALGQTDDLTVETVQRMLEIDPTMAQYFEAEQLTAMASDVLEVVLNAEISIDPFTRDALAARQLAESITGEDSIRVPVDLPNEWRIQPPELITFSFSDIPLATFFVSSTGDVEAALQETIETESAVTEATGAEETETITSSDETGEDGPALPDAIAQIGSMLGTELDTADDLLNAIVIPAPVNALLGVDELTAAALLNLVVEPPEQLAAMGNAMGDPADLIAQISPDVIIYLAENDETFLPSLLPGVFELFNEDVQALDVVIAARENAVVDTSPTLPEAWNLLASQPQFQNMPLETAQDLLAFGNAAEVLNSINDNVGDFAGYEVRLFSSLTPEILRYFVEQEPDFYEALDRDVLTKFAPEVLEELQEDDAFIAVYDADAIQDLIAEAEAVVAANAIPSNGNNNNGIPEGPALNPEWLQIAGFYNMELDTADDLIMGEDSVYPDAGALINSLYQNPQGANFAPQLLGNLPEDAVAFILENEPTAFNSLTARALQDVPDNIMALLPEALQQRKEEGSDIFVPTAQLTRTNGNDSLFVTVYKTAEANTVTTFSAVEELMEKLDEADENIEIGIVFEQSSFVEQSVEGVAREGSLGAVFAVIIILIFLSGGTWNLRGRRLTGAIMGALFLGLLLLLVASNLDAAGNDWGEAFAQSDTVLRVLFIVGFIASIIILAYPGNLPDPAWRATVVIAVSIPLSIMIALTGMYWISPAMHDLISPLAENNAFFEFVLRLFPEQLTLNIMTLSGLTVAVGRVVDDSIVVLENIFRQLQSTENTREAKLEAIRQGTRDVSAAIFTATLIAVVVFLPLGLTGGLIGAFFLPFGLAVTYALIGSFIVAVTVVPVLAFMFLSIEDMPEEGDIWVADYYLPVLRWALSSKISKAIVLGLAVLSFFFAMYLFSQRPFAFLPNFGEPQIQVNVTMPPGTSIITTDTLVRELEAYLTNPDNIDPEKLKTIQVTVGGGGANFESLLTGNSVDESRANIIIGLDVSQEELAIFEEQIDLEAKRIFNTCPESELEGREQFAVAEVDGKPDIVCADGTPRTNNVETSAASVADGGFGGFALVVSGPVTAEMNDAIIDTLNSIDGISKAESNFVPLDATAGDSDTPPTYIRVNQVTAYSYTAELDTENTIGVTQLALQEIQKIPEVEALLCEGENPDFNTCIKVSEGFQSEIQTQGFQSLGFAMILAIGLVVIILMFTMQSVVYWLAIVLSILVAPVGAAIALASADRVLGISALIGLLMLIGLVIANAVVLIDRVRSNQNERGMELKDALIEAGGRRLRPILMTSMATIIALIPLAVGLSQGAIIAAELGTVVIGGSISSTLLTLIVVPVMYSILSPVHRALSPGRYMGSNKKDEAED